MPKLFYAYGAAAFCIWGTLLWYLATVIPGESQAVELGGTLLTLLPVVLDLLRKYYVRRHAPPPSASGFPHWVHERVREALLGYEALYAWAIFAGVSLVALGFAMDLHKSHS